MPKSNYRIVKVFITPESGSPPDERQSALALATVGQRIMRRQELNLSAPSSLAPSLFDSLQGLVGGASASK